MEDHELYKLVERIARVEAGLSAFAERGWVHDLIKPISDSLARTESSVDGLVHAVDGMTDNIKSLFAAHDQLLKDRAAQEREISAETISKLRAEREAARDNTITAIIKEKWVPVVGFILGLATLLGVIGQVVMSWLNHYVLIAPKH